MTNETAVRQHLSRCLAWADAHVTLEKAVAGVGPEWRGRRIDSFPHTLWQLLEHLRIAQADLLAFCHAGEYTEPVWPDDYWPASDAPRPDQWDASIAAYLADRAALQELTSDESLDLLAIVPHGTDQTYLREILLVIDHGAYHVGQIVALRQAMGIWPAS